MTIIIKILAFLAVNAASFTGISIAFHGAVMNDILDQNIDRTIIDAFYQKGLYIWATGAALSVGFFIIKNTLKYLLLFAPIIAVGIYGLKFVFFSA